MNLKKLYEKLKKHRKVFLVLVILLIVIACAYSIYNYNREKFISPLETIVYKPGYLISGSDSSLRIISLERKTFKPVAEASVSIALENSKTSQKEQLYQGKTNVNGSPDIRFKVPEDFDGDCQLIVKVCSPIGNDKVLIPVTVRKGFEILLTSDKTVYRPGQTMHIRGLVFENSNAANRQKVKVQVYEPSGNRVFTKELETCNYGIASTDFTLGDEIRTGTYTIKANIGTYCQQKKVHVSGEPPPRFNIRCSTEKSWYVPGQKVKGKVNAAYFFGKPVIQGNVKVVLYKNQKEKWGKMSEFNGLTNYRGMFNFEYQLPDNKKSQVNEKSPDLLYRLKVETTVQNASYQLEKNTHFIPVSRDNLLIQLVPESGKPKPGLENTFYVATTYPDGTPTACQLEIETWIDGNPKNTQNNKTLQTNQWGIGQLKLNITPQQQNDLFHLQARDNQGNKGEKVWHYSLDENQQESILLRTDKSLYHIGETMDLTILSTQKQGHVYLDLLKNNQVVLTKNSELVNGKSHLKLRIHDKMTGTLTCCARTTMKSSKKNSPLLWDLQKIIVQPDKENQINLVIQPDKKQYYPGQEASINVFTSQKGKACPAALGINILEGSGALMEQKSFGLETFIYNIDKRLWQSNLRQAGFSFPQLLRQENETTALSPRDKQEISAVLLASQLPTFYRTKDFTEMISTQENLRNNFVKKRQFQIFQMYLLIVILILVAVILFYSVKQKEKLLFWTVLLFILYMVTFHGVMDFFSDYPYGNMYGTLPLLPLIASILIPLVFSIYGVRFLRSRNKRTVLLTFIVTALCVLPLFIGIVYYYPLKGGGGESPQVTLLPHFSIHRPGQARDISDQPIESKQYRQVLDRFSPDTLYFNPRVITDSSGQGSFTIKLADLESNAPRQLFALAHNLKGEIGVSDCPVPVFRGIFLDLDAPPHLTQGDEISIPAAIHNYLDTPQTVTLSLQHENWFDLKGSATRTAAVNPRDIRVVYFKIKAKGLGNQRMKLHAYAPGISIKKSMDKEISVFPAGKEVLHSYNYNLKGNEEIQKRLFMPETSIKDSDKLLVKIFPAFTSQIDDGFESMLRMPHGCFEQTSSFTYPNIMVLDYMRRTGQDTPAIKERAENYISEGYQKLLQFEAQEGGFSFFRAAGYAQEIFSAFTGNAQKILTAYGLMLFTDMKEVYPIDKEIIPRIQKWLLSKMTGDHWESDSHFGAASSDRNNDFAATGYITWALLHSGLDKDDKGIKKAIAYLEKNYTSYLNNPNALSYCAISLTKAEKNAAPVIQRLNELVKSDQDGTYWTPVTYITGGFATASVANIETTAMAALANLEANHRSIDILQIIHYLLKNKTALGNWGSTQATVLTLKVLTRALPKYSEPLFGMVKIEMNKKTVKEIIFTEENNTAMHIVDLKDFIGVFNPEVKIKFQGHGELYCQILSSYYLRWDDPSLYQTRSPINLDMTYNTNRLARGEISTAEVNAFYTGKGKVNFAIIDIGIPPGFKANPEDFKRIRAKGTIERYEINRGRIVLYLNDLDKKGMRFKFSLRAVTEAFVKMPETRIYDYYNPDIKDLVQPIEFKVI